MGRPSSLHAALNQQAPPAHRDLALIPKPSRALRMEREHPARLQLTVVPLRGPYHSWRVGRPSALVVRSVTTNALEDVHPSRVGEPPLVV